MTTTVHPATAPAQTPTHPEAPGLPGLLRWLLGITAPVHPPLLFSLACRVINLALDIALFATAAGGVVMLATTGGSVWKLVGILVVLSLAKAGGYYLEQFSGHYVAFKSLELLRTHVFAALWPKAPAVVTHSRSGDVLTSLTRDVDRIEVVYAHTFAPVVSAYIIGPAAIITAGTWMGWSTVWVAAICLGLSLLVVPYVAMPRAFRATATNLAQRRDLAQHMSDSVFGLAEVVGYGREADRLADLDASTAQLNRSAAIARDIAAARRGANVTLMLVAAVSVVALGGAVHSAATLAALAAATLRVFEAPRGIEDSTRYLDHSLAAVRRLWELSHAVELVTDGPDHLALPHAPAVSFANVTYRYPAATTATNAPIALHNVSFTVPAGGHGLIVGRSGSGKSTLVQLLQRYDDPTDGQISLDGTPIQDYTLDSLRANVVAVSQRNQLLNATIAANLRLGAPEATDAELWEVLQVVGIDAEVRQMPAQLATMIGANNGGVSGGQAQRLSLARALLMRPRVLILDEFTSALNTELVHAIKQRLRSWLDGVTVIEISHRLDSTTEADVIMMLDQGHVVLAGAAAEISQAQITSEFTQPS